MSETQPNKDTEQTKTILLYDADAPQRVPFEVKRRGRRYKVAHNVDPITDDDVLEFERAKNVRLTESDSNETDEADATDITSSLFKPAVELWGKRSTSVENYALKNPDNWKEEVTERDRAYAINGVLMAIQFVPLPVASADEACPADDDDESVYPMRAVFNGHVVDLLHALRRPTGPEMEEFQSLMSRVTLVQGTKFGETDQRIPSRAKRLGELYRKVKLRAEGYAGRVPLHHQMAVALRHFRAEHKLNSGNS